MDVMNLIWKIENIIEESDAQKYAYFKTPPSSASSRRMYERQHSHDKVEWIEGGHTYTAEYSVSCSCKNVYAKGYYSKDGLKTTLTAIKNSLNRLKTMAAKVEVVENV